MGIIVAIIAVVVLGAIINAIFHPIRTGRAIGGCFGQLLILFLALIFLGAIIDGCNCQLPHYDPPDQERPHQRNR